MKISDAELAAIGSIASLFGGRLGSSNIDRVLKTFNITDAPPNANKAEKIAFVLRKFMNDPRAFSGFMTSLIRIHTRTLSKEDVSFLNSHLKTLGYQIKDGVVVTTALEDIVRFVKLPPDLAGESQRMVEAYVILYYLENQLRAFVKERMEEAHGVNWWENNVPSQIKKECEKRKRREEESPWHEVKEAHLLWYTTFGELQQIIQANWDVFKGYFKDQHAIIGRLSELEIPRNTIAHNRVLEKAELERLRVFSRDILRVIARSI